MSVNESSSRVGPGRRSWHPLPLGRRRAGVEQLDLIGDHLVLGVGVSAVVLPWVVLRNATGIGSRALLPPDRLALRGSRFGRVVPHAWIPLCVRPQARLAE